MKEGVDAKPWTTLVGIDGVRSIRIHSQAELAFALMDAAWVGNAAVGMECHGFGLDFDIDPARKLSKAMKDYAWRGYDARSDIARSAGLLADQAWPSAVALWEAHLIKAESLCSLDPSAMPEPKRSTLHRM
jgi:hypothetical protein